MQSTRAPAPSDEIWPPLPLEEWRDSHAVLHMWVQIVGKIRLALVGPADRWWHSGLYVSGRGLSSGLVPLPGGALQLDFDFFDHNLLISAGGSRQRRLLLPGRSVAGFYRELMKTLAELGVEVAVDPLPVGVENPVPFEQDTRSAYLAGAVQRFWRILTQATRILERFRAGFFGRCSTVQLFWGSFELALLVLSGRPTATRTGAPSTIGHAARPAYAQELSGVGFWPGGDGFAEPAFYAYASPEPASYRHQPLRTAAAFYSDELGEFLLPYQALRSAPDPDAMLLGFLEDSYRAAASSGGWDSGLHATPH